MGRAARLLTEAATAEYLSVPSATVRRLLIGRVVIDGRVRFDRVALDAWLDELRGVVPPSPAANQNTDDEAAIQRFFADQGYDARSS